MLCCAVNFETYERILKYKTAKEMWDELENSHGNNYVYNSSTPESHPSTTNSDLPPIAIRRPCGVFFEETRDAMGYYLKNCVPLYKHALQGNWKKAKALIVEDPRLRNAAIAKGSTTLLHIAASVRGGAKHVHFAKQLIEELSEGDLLLIDDNGNTAFCLAAAAGNKQVLDLMKNKNPTVVQVRGNNRTFPPVRFAALQGRCDVASHLYENPEFGHYYDDELKQLFFTCINTGLYGLALKLATDRPYLASERDENGETALHLLSKSHLDSCCQSPQHQSSIIKINPGMKQQVVFQLVKKLWSIILEEKSSMREIFETLRDRFQLLFAAVEVGNFGFLSEILSAYPNLIWTKDDSTGQTIIHKAVKHRHASIFNLIHEIGSVKDIIVTMMDKKRNTLLHLAAKRAPPQRQLELVSGAAFQMCLELVWFKEVKKIMPPSLINYKNSAGKTASELFSEEHKELRKDAESWMKSTAENCMLIATVIATGVFAAAIAVPGGVDDKGGKPNYLGKTSWFLVFTISDATAFISSAASILIFLSILLSRYTENDFYKSLPLKLMCGLVALSCSITSMMVAFASAFFITYHHYASHLVPILVSISASLPAILFFILQIRLWLEIIYSTICCKKLFKPSKKMLYALEN
ncbi:uncharacterized protein LOC107483765 [Arachis duranensis]|uniref:Uncharacterized protein LOC107483765 n=1 Tax=Arachis duranensis TaxID=130453 RepID=A0A6P4D604_ARADU|nr:uncharacterized protein LOC107483765 [Arachis duranensis]